MIRRSLLIGTCLWLVVGCAGGQPPTPTADLPTPTPGPTATPTPGQTVTLAPTAAPTQSLQSDQCDRSTSDNPARPPDAFVAPTGGGGPVAGKLGSFTYCDIAADALPPRAENVEALALGQPPTVVMSSGGAFTAYRAAYWPASEWQGDPVQLAQADTLAPATTAEFNGPPAGDWVLAIHVTFGQEGNATYYWHVTVP